MHRTPRSIRALRPRRDAPGWYARNNPWVSSTVLGLVANAAGAGIKPRSLHPDPVIRERLRGLWQRWTDRADAAVYELPKLASVVIAA